MTARRSIRTWLQQLHLWVGLVLLLPLVTMGVTGAVLVYADNVHDLLGGATPSATTRGEWRAAGDLIAAATAVQTEPGRIPIAVHWPTEIGEPAAVRLSRPGMAHAKAPQPAQMRPQNPFAGSVQVMVDPVSLQVLDQQEGMPRWVRFFHDLHGHLFITGGVGRSLVGWLGVAMLVLGCSGLFLWWPRGGRWREAFTVRRGAKGLRLHRDLHGAIGIWSLPIFLAVNFTGVYITFPQTFAVAVNAVSPSRDLRAATMQARVEPVHGAQPIAVDEAIALAQDGVPDARVLGAFLPTRPDQPLRVTLARTGHREGAPTITVVVDPWRRSIVEVIDPQTMSAGETFMAWQRALHEGVGLGGAYKFLVFLSGVIIPAFAVTGFLMWWIKRRARRASASARTGVQRMAAKDHGR